MPHWQSDGDGVVVKLLVRSQELEILEHLHSIKSSYNHTIPLLGSLESNTWTFIFLPEATPLNLAFAYGMFCNDVLDSSRQLIEGVAYLHGRGIAHVDIKPQNVVVLPNQLFIIDFDIAVHVDGPKCLYSPIRADLWSCGLMLRYLASKGAVEEENPVRDTNKAAVEQKPTASSPVWPWNLFAEVRSLSKVD
jgi:serine/threonine protein kinase